MALSMPGCSSHGDTIRPSAAEVPRTPSRAMAQDGSTSIGAAMEELKKQYPGQSGFRFLATGKDSLQMRMALIQAAEKSVDLQYYTIHDDTTANLLLEALLRASARGVRVRFLIDNISLKDVGESLSVLDGNQNIQIRVFNPLTTRTQPFLERMVGKVADLGQANKRMHNKALISDNQMAIIGGRNLGDEYFDSHNDVAFKDTDMLAAGPITDAISKSFDHYWNSEDSFPINALRPPVKDKQKMEEFRKELQENWEKSLATDHGKQILASNLPKRLKDGDIGLIWAKSDLAADDPKKIDQPKEETDSKPLARIDRLLGYATKEFVAVSPYFVPQDDGVAWLKGLVDKGINVRVLTNSLGSTDVVAVHTGYRRYREALLKGGIELYEFKAINNQRPEQRVFGTTAPAHASLHAKIYVIDRKDVVIGSFNLDPRSIEINTEMAVIIHSEALAAQVLKMFNEAIAPESSYRVTLKPGLFGEEIVWQTQEDGKNVDYTHEPKAGVWRRVQTELFSLLPIENQL